jgi:hypothetical protein
MIQYYPNSFTSLSLYGKYAGANTFLQILPNENNFSEWRKPAEDSGFLFSTEEGKNNAVKCIASRF